MADLLETLTQRMVVGERRLKQLESLEVTSIPLYNVRSAGAVGDDATDDTAIMQQTFDAGTGRHILVPSGIYRVSAPLTVGDDTTVWFAPGATLRPTNPSAAVITATVGATRNIGVRGLHVDGSLLVTPDGAAGNAIDLTAIANVVIDQCLIEHMGRGGVALRNCTNLRILNNHLLDIGANHYNPGVHQGTGITLLDCIQGIIGENTLDTMWQMAIFLSQNGGGGCSRITIDHNVVTGCLDNGIRLNNGTLYDAVTAPLADNLDGAHDCIVSNNIITDVAVDGVRCSGYNNQVIGNKIIGDRVLPVTGIKTDQGSNQLIAENEFTNCGVGVYVRMGISKHGTDGMWDSLALTIHHNTVVNCGSGIVLTQASGDQILADCEITGNIINTTPLSPGIGHGILARYGQRLTIAGNLIRSTSFHAIAILPQASGLTSDVTIHDNAIYNTKTTGIAVYRTARLEVTDNRIYPATPTGAPLIGWVGIGVVDCTGWSVTNNNIYRAGSAGMTIANSEHGVISENVVADSQQGDAGGATGYANYGGITIQLAVYVQTLTVAAVPGATTLTLDDTDQLETGHTVSITLDVGGPFVTTLLSIDSQFDVTLAAPMPSSAAIGKTLSMNGLYVPDSILITGNHSYDAGSGLQKYGLRVIGACTNIRIDTNDFSDNVTAETLIDAAALVIQGTTNLFEVVNDAAGAGILRVRTFGVNGLSTNAPFVRGMSARGTHALPTGVVSGDALLRLQGQGYTSAGAYATGANIIAVADETWSGTQNGAYITMLLAMNGTTAAVTRWKLFGSGQVQQFFSTANTVTTAEALALQSDSTGTPGVGFGHSVTHYLESSTTIGQQAARDEIAWATAANATRKARRRLYVSDAAGERLAIEIGTDGTQPLIGLNGAAGTAKGTITGAKAGNVALANLLTYLALRGDIIDSTT